MQVKSMGSERTDLDIRLVVTKTWLWFSSLCTCCVKPEVFAGQCLCVWERQLLQVLYSCPRERPFGRFSQVGLKSCACLAVILYAGFC